MLVSMPDDESLSDLDNAESIQKSRFPTTQWTHIHNLRGDSRDAAMNHICRTYWFPLYVSARYQGMTPQDAEDTIQEFMMRMIEQNGFIKASAERGRLRNFLYASLKNFISNRRRKGAAVKAGGGTQNFLSINIDNAESLYHDIAEKSSCIDRAYAFAWAQEMIRICMSRLRDMAKTRGQEELFELMTPFLLQESDLTIVQLASRKGLSPENLRVYLHRMRLEFRNELHRQVSSTVEDQSQVADEIRELMGALS